MGFTRSMNQLWGDEVLTRRMGNNARETVVAKYSWRSVALQLQDVFEDMLKN
ncbi:MAG: hypothetical protein ACFFEE_13540 [Candidatus Thorarchaeota archaeon]